MIQRSEASIMHIGPKMTFILSIYQMTENENAQDFEDDRAMFRAGVMSERTVFKRCGARSIARRIRRHDETGSWPRDARKKTDGPVIVGGHTLQ
jgi:hypothetical protein